MKRLFVVRHRDGWHDTDTNNNGQHESKESAKAHRNRMNQGLTAPLYFVSPGPDHRNYRENENG